VQSADGLNADWFRPDDIAGITAGTSTPENVINEVEQKIQQLNKEKYELALYPA
jgi:4-hydroxy-3-methylbut-2-enyl diphosphate reductase IspH